MKSDSTTVAENMSRGLIFLHPNNKLLTAFRLMNNHNIRHIPVIEDEKLVGIISDRDILLHLSVSEERGEELLNVPDKLISEICSEELITCNPFTSLADAAELMLFHEIDSLPVVGNNKNLLGIITSADLLKFMSTDQDNGAESFKIEDLLAKIPVNHGGTRAYM